jgi:hypothetical protein
MVYVPCESDYVSLYTWKSGRWLCHCIACSILLIAYLIIQLNTAFTWHLILSASLIWPLVIPVSLNWKINWRKWYRNIKTVDPTHLTFRVIRMLSEHCITLPAFIGNIHFILSRVIIMNCSFQHVHMSAFYYHLLHVFIVCCVYFMFIHIVCILITRMFLCLSNMLEVPQLCCSCMIEVTSF